MRLGLEPLPPKIIKYRNYKNFHKDKFRSLFKKRLNDFKADDITVDIFKMTFLNVLNKFAPLKKKYLRANHSRFVNKELNKTVIQRSRANHSRFVNKELNKAFMLRSRANHSRFVNKELNKAFMLRSRLRS